MLLRLLGIASDHHLEGPTDAERSRRGPTTRAMARRIHAKLETKPSSQSILFCW